MSFQLSLSHLSVYDWSMKSVEYLNSPVFINVLCHSFISYLEIVLRLIGILCSVCVCVCDADNVSFTQRLRVDRRLQVHNGCVSRQLYCGN